MRNVVWMIKSDKCCRITRFLPARWLFRRPQGGDTVVVTTHWYLSNLPSGRIWHVGNHAQIKIHAWPLQKMLDPIGAMSLALQSKYYQWRCWRGFSWDQTIQINSTHPTGTPGSLVLLMHSDTFRYLTKRREFNSLSTRYVLNEDVICICFWNPHPKAWISVPMAL